MRLNDPETKQAHRLAAVDLIWRAFDKPFKSEQTYQETIDSIAKMLAAGRPVILIRRAEDMIEILSPNP